jgi:hypothetical protein
MSDLQNALIFLFVAAILFRQIAVGSSEHGLLTILVFLGVFAAIYAMTGGDRGPLGAVTRTAATITAPKVSAGGAAGAGVAEGFQQAIAGRREAYTDRFSIGRFNKLRFLPKNPAMSRIAHDLRFVRVFDKARYADLLLYMEKFQKTYTYILGDRYDLRSYTGTLMDLRDAVSEVLYSLVFAVPATFRHSYGFLPYPIIQSNIEAFQTLSRKMIQVTENYARSRGDAHFPSVAPRPYEASRSHQLP